MNDRIFDSPVFVKSGNSLVQEIACLEDALEFPYEGRSINAVQFIKLPFVHAKEHSTATIR
ncbi:hypothetical protein [Mesorhizobium sp.]|uniref:hypothetical protein n=1 Tax=Mesorhizobium sp. TaxID=1871066 RepID=UPI003457733D